ncbi:uncharacterized protein F4812DRAFT_460455 [Daldinia caldariorum]|uniref:uncharacterized protein n=1 Tax=Daldinia caldariorum TaxID=326644 RepID=UPI00200860CC|nr:uncharacterized protein F4812DRAFT_460455 [Daldinia caldariorum]KAI1466898.1 hypothetical protein F4812DRAFT_460455 [Daldinia caldariorum]
MCFVEYVGYTCGHTSLPVVRPCPMTTQMHTNPTCPRPACRPMLPPSMCPSCGRILHGRFVDIVEHEHRFMHERGACSCDIRFPHLQQPRMLAPSGTGVGIGLGIGLSVAEPPATAHMDGSQFAFSPSAAAFTPQPSAAASIVTTATTNTLPSNNNNSSSNSISIGNTPSDVRSASPEFPNRRKGKQQQRWKGKGRGGHHHQQHPHLYPHNNNNAAATGGNQQQRRRASTLASASTTTTAITPRHGQGQGHGHVQGGVLPPLFEGREHDPSYSHSPPSPSSRRLSVSVRMLSLYGAEWARDHAELHRAGRCACDVTFDRYTGHPELASGHNSSSSSSSMTMIQYSENDVRRYDESESQSADAMSAYAYNNNHSSNAADAGISNYQNPQESGYASAFQSPADQAAHPYPHISDTVQRYWTPYATQPISPGQPARSACGPYDTSTVAHGNEQQLPEHQHPEYHHQQQEHEHEYDAAASGMPVFPNMSSSISPSATASMSVGISGHPVDMQTIYYEPRGTPIVGLPVGAGPEGDSHMPPFEDCELYYPKLAPHQRPASR